MNYQEAHGKTPKEAWWNFHKANKHVYELFKKQAWRSIRRQEAMGRVIVPEGQKPPKGKSAIKLSSKLIINYLRWEFQFEDNSKDELKINDIVTPYYARLFIHEFPEYNGVFNTRNLRSNIL